MGRKVRSAMKCWTMESSGERKPFFSDMNHILALIYLGSLMCTAGCQWRISPNSLKAWISAACLLIFWTDPLDVIGNHNVVLANGLKIQLVVPYKHWVDIRLVI